MGVDPATLSDPLESWSHWGELSAGKMQVVMVILLGAQMDVMDSPDSQEYWIESN